MKKIVNVNIGGVPFTLDEDAFNLLEQYLNTLRGIYHNDDEDMISDIESRIAELLLQNVAEGRIVTVEDIRREIAVIGDPHDFDDEETIINEEKITVSSGEETERIVTDAQETPPASPVTPPQVEHKLFRDPRNKMIAGVCSGIAVYNHMSVNLVRIITVAAFFLTMVFPLGAALSVWIIPIVYACFWIAVPEAHTPLQFMQLYGVSGSMANVAKAVNTQYAPNIPAENYNDSPAGFWNTIGKIIMAIVKGFFAFLAIVVGVPVIIGLIIVAIALIITGLAWMCSNIGNMDFTATFPRLAEIISELPASYGWILVAIISALGTLLIPAWFLIRSVFKLEGRFPLTRRSRIIWLLVWIFCILMGISATSIIAA